MANSEVQYNSNYKQSGSKNKNNTKQHKPAFKEDFYEEIRCQRLNVKIWNII